MPRLHIKRHINQMNQISFKMLSWGLLIFSSSLTFLSVNLCNDYQLGAADLLYKYPPLLERITLPFVFLLGVALIIDVNDKRRGK